MQTTRRRSALGGTGRFTLLSLLIVGCAKSGDSARDGGAPAGQAARDAGADGAGGEASEPIAEPIAPRDVFLEVLPIGTREITQGDDGEPVYGPIEPLEGARVCIAQRRDAYASFEPFEPLEPPVCVESERGEVVHIEGAPVNSDLVITVEYEGLRPQALTHRTDTYDVAIPDWASTTSWTLLLEARATDPWLEPSVAPADYGVVAVSAFMVWAGLGGNDFPAALNWDGTLPSTSESMPIWAAARDVEVWIDPYDGEQPLRTLSRPRSLALPEGSARFRFRHPHLNCIPIGARQRTEFGGLPAGGLDTIEVPVLAGHAHVAAVECHCPSRPGEELVDLGSCSFEPGPDAGSP